jgi:hypothetical protein
MTMVYEGRDRWVFGLCLSFGILKNTKKQWLGLDTSNGPNKQMCLLPPNMRTETDQVSETFCSLEYRTMTKVQKPSNPEWNMEYSLKMKTQGSAETSVFIYQIYEVKS